MDTLGVRLTLRTQPRVAELRTSRRSLGVAGSALRVIFRPLPPIATQSDTRAKLAARSLAFRMLYIGGIYIY